MNLKNSIRLKNCNIQERITQGYQVEAKNKDQTIKIAKELKKEWFAFRYSKNYILVFCEYYSQVKRLMEIIKAFNCRVVEEKIIIMYEIETSSKSHAKKLAKMLYKNEIFYKIPYPRFLWVFCGHGAQIQRFREVLEKFDFISPLIKAE